MDVELATRYGQANQGSMDVAGRFGRKSNWMFVIIGASLLMITLMRFKPLCPDEVFAAGYGADAFPDRALLRTVDKSVCTLTTAVKYEDIYTPAEFASMKNSDAIDKSAAADLMKVCDIDIAIEIESAKILKPQCCAFALAADTDQSEGLSKSEVDVMRNLLRRYKDLIWVYYRCAGFKFKKCEADKEDIAATVRGVFHKLDKNKDNWLEQSELVGIFAAFGSAVASPRGGMSERSFYGKMHHLTMSYPFLLDRDYNGVLDSKEMELINYFFANNGKVSEAARCSNLVLWVSRVQRLRKLVSLKEICQGEEDTLKKLKKLGVIACPNCS